MLFSSVIFFFFFLTIVIGSNYILPHNVRNYVLLFYSIIFYTWGGLAYLPLLIISIVMNYVFGLKINKHEENQKKHKRMGVYNKLDSR